MTLSHRNLLQAGSGVFTTLGFAGCIGSYCGETEYLTLKPASTGELTERLATPVTRLGMPDQRIVHSAIDGGTSHRACGRPLNDDIYVVGNSYYQLTSTVEDEQPGTRYAIEFEIRSPESLTTQPPADQTIPFESLPEIDQLALQRKLLADVFARAQKLEPPVKMSGSGSICYPADASNDSSMLIPDAQNQYIEYEEMYNKLSVEESSETTLDHYQIQTEAIPSSSTEFVQYAYSHLLAEVVNLDEMSLSEQQETILEKAVQGGNGGSMSTCLDNPSPAFEDLIQKIFSSGADSSDIPQPRPIIWKGNQYLATYEIAVV